MYLGVILGIALPLIVIWAVMTRQLAFALTHFRFQQRVTPKQMITELPSVSVCIPARNEMHVMTECLESVLASTYPKLEVIVLDDRSEDTTSTLVKAFARDGVRFVEGKKLPPGWLGKNYALLRFLYGRRYAHPARHDRTDGRLHANRKGSNGVGSAAARRWLARQRIVLTSSLFLGDYVSPPYRPSHC
jgi:cellulose synthase/poly-beta-1,6-N-acetylglucosamine synthase-like glycosyltransferase